MKAVFIIVVVIAVLVSYSVLRMSSICSREEERQYEKEIRRKKAEREVTEG